MGLGLGPRTLKALRFGPRAGPSASVRALTLGHLDRALGHRPGSWALVIGPDLGPPYGLRALCLEKRVVLGPRAGAMNLSIGSPWAYGRALGLALGSGTLSLGLILGHWASLGLGPSLVSRVGAVGLGHRSLCLGI